MTTERPTTLAQLKTAEAAIGEALKGAKRDLSRYELLVEFLRSKRPELGAVVLVALREADAKSGIRPLGARGQYSGLIEELKPVEANATPA
jgi:hypothetical protein